MHIKSFPVQTKHMHSPKHNRSNIDAACFHKIWTHFGWIDEHRFSWLRHYIAFFFIYIVFFYLHCFPRFSFFNFYCLFTWFLFHFWQPRFFFFLVWIYSFFFIALPLLTSGSYSLISYFRWRHFYSCLSFKNITLVRFFSDRFLKETGEFFSMALNSVILLQIYGIFYPADFTFVVKKKMKTIKI